MIDLVRMHNEILGDIIYHMFDYSILKKPFDLLNTKSEYVEGDSYIITMDYKGIRDRYRLDSDSEFNLLKTKEETVKIDRQKFYIRGFLYNIYDEFEIDLRDIKKYGIPTNEYQRKRLVEDISRNIKDTLKLKVDAYWNTMLYMLREILNNDNVVIDGKIINTPFQDSSGNIYPRVNGAAVGINGNFTANTVNPLIELRNFRNYIENQDYIVELPIQRYICIMGQGAWDKFLSNANIQNMRNNWFNNIESSLGYYKEQKFKRDILRYMGSFEDIDIYVPEPKLQLRIGGNRVDFIGPNQLFLIAVIDRNFIHPYNTGEYFVKDRPVIYAKPSKFVEIIDMTQDPADSKLALRRYVIVGKTSLNVLFTHAIGYLTVS